MEDYILNGEPEDKTSLDWYRWRAVCIVDNPNVQWTLSSLIIFNAVTIGINADYQGPETPALEAVETVLVVCVA